MAIEFRCEICGKFLVGGLDLKIWKNQPLSTTQKLHCIAQNIKDNSEGLIPIWSLGPRGTGVHNLPYIARGTADYENRPILHSTKPTEFLKLLAGKLRNSSPFAVVKVDKKDAFILKMDGDVELWQWLMTIIKNGYIKATSHRFDSESSYTMPSIEDIRRTLDITDFIITPDGWSHIETLSSNLHSQKAFIAMSFGYPGRASLQQAIEDACAETGWEGFTIDNIEHVNGITDEIIGKINESRFVIAEFTENKHGVYFEAGYALGKDLPVIYVVKQSEMNAIHFDTRHINHITWETVEELKKKLINRIKAVIND